MLPPKSFPLERKTESELRRPWRVCNARVLGRLAVLRVVLLRHIRTVIRMVERVEELHQPFGLDAPAELEALLQPQVDAVNRLADEVIQRNDRPIRSQ